MINSKHTLLPSNLYDHSGRSMHLLGLWPPSIEKALGPWPGYDELCLSERALVMKAIRGPLYEAMAVKGEVPEELIAQELPFLVAKDVIRVSRFIEAYKLNRHNSCQLLNDHVVQAEYERVKKIRMAEEVRQAAALNRAASQADKKKTQVSTLITLNIVSTTTIFPPSKSLFSF